jgi:hypothetical protein
VTIEAVLDAPVFSAGGHTFTWGDIVTAARCRGEWQRLETETRERMLAEQVASHDSSLPPAAEVQAAIARLRYRANLLSADELNRWLGRWGISLDEVIAHARRSLLDVGQIDAASATVSSEESERASWVAAVCSGTVVSLANRLAQQVAVHLRQVEEQPPGPTDDELAAAARADVTRFAAQQVTEAALAAETAANLVEWTHVQCRYLALAGEMAAREAALCVRTDGRSIEDVAVDAGVPVNDRGFYVEDVDPSLRGQLLAAAPGQLLGPVPVADQHWLILISDRVPATLADPAVRARAQRRVSERVVTNEVNRRVRWHERL